MGNFEDGVKECDCLRDCVLPRLNRAKVRADSADPVRISHPCAEGPALQDQEGTAAGRDYKHDMHPKRARGPDAERHTEQRGFEDDALLPDGHPRHLLRVLSNCEDVRDVIPPNQAHVQQADHQAKPRLPQGV